MGIDPPAPFHPTATRKKRSDGIKVKVAVVLLRIDEFKDPFFYVSHRENDILSLPMGTLELYETWEQCAIRVIYEQMNIQLTKEMKDNIEFLHACNIIEKEQQEQGIDNNIDGVDVDEDDDNEDRNNSNDSTSKQHSVIIYMITKVTTQMLANDEIGIISRGWESLPWDELILRFHPPLIAAGVDGCYDETSIINHETLTSQSPLFKFIEEKPIKKLIQRYIERK